MESIEQIQQRIQATAKAGRRTSNNMKKQAPAKDGQMAFVVTRATLSPNPAQGDKDGNGAGCPVVAVNVAPLKDEEDVTSVDLAFENVVWLTLPIINEAIEGHTVSAKATSVATSQLSAFAPDEVTYVPRKDEAGAWINGTDQDAKILAAQVQAVQFAYTVKENPKVLEGSKFYATTKAAPADKGGYYINALSSEKLPKPEGSLE